MKDRLVVQIHLTKEETTKMIETYLYEHYSNISLNDTFKIKANIEFGETRINLYLEDTNA